jgi:hypothetical protein
VKNKKQYTYEEKSDVIDQELRKRKRKWFLTSVAWFDFEDVEQIIRCHIHKKWHLWDQKRALEPWLNRVISNQIKNILRNNYFYFAKPCLSCPFNESKNIAQFDGDSEDCSFTPSGKQCSECPLFQKWSKSKKNAYDVKIPTTLENHENYDLSSLSLGSNFNIEMAIEKLEFHLKKVLSEKDFECYKMLFIEKIEDEEVAKKLGFISNEIGREAGYKQIKNIKKKIKEKAIAIIKTKDIIY